METEFMNQESIIALLKNQGLDPIAKKETEKLFVSKKVIRCEMGDTLIAGMGSDNKKDDQIHLVVDAVHLCLQAKDKKKSLRLIFGRREVEKEQAEVENAVALMIESIKTTFKIETEVDDKKIDFKSKSFNEEKRIESWMQYMSQEKNIPELAKDLETAIDNELFKWYRSVTGQYWSGRVGGLEVCKLDLKGQEGKLNVGSPGKKGDRLARQKFKDIVAKENINEDHFLFSRPQIDKVASIIRAIAKSRRNIEKGKNELSEFQKEHLLESYVLSGKLEIVSKVGVLKSVVEDYPFQFPTLWAPSAKPRFVDALMSRKNIPYVVELKEPSGGSSTGQDYRHAITQAVLYREFIRRAEKLHPWFKRRELDPSECRAVVAFPEMSKGDERQEMLLNQHTLVAEAFGVEIVEIKGFE